MKTINDVVRMKNKKFEKLKILIVYQTFRIQIFKLLIIRYVFKITNIISFNFNIMFNIIRQKIIKNAQQFCIFNFSSQLMKHIFKNSEFIRKFKRKIERTLKEIKFNENIMIKKIVDCLQRYVQKTVTVINTLNFIVRNFDQMQRTFMKRKIRAELNDTVAAKKKS